MRATRSDSNTNPYVDEAQPNGNSSAHDMAFDNLGTSPEALTRALTLRPGDDQALSELLRAYPGYSSEILTLMAPHIGLAAVMRAIRTASVSQPALPTAGNARDPKASIRDVARGRVDLAGTADDADRAVVAAELEHLPLSALRLMVRLNRRVAVCRNSIVEVMTNLRGVVPRGWEGTGKSWDDVQGVGDDGHGRIVIATRNGRIPQMGEGHGASNLVMHEVAHCLDRSFDESGTPEFKEA